MPGRRLLAASVGAVVLAVAHLAVARQPCSPKWRDAKGRCLTRHSRGTLTVGSNLPGARVQVAGHQRGRTPVTLRLRPGVYLVTVSAKDRTAERRLVTVMPGSRQTVTIPVCSDGRHAVGPACCYAGQGWNGRVCTGTPAYCPGGWVREQGTCRLPACTNGRKRMADGAHCCWPGQRWSADLLSCVGRPRCPKGWVAHTLGCVPGPTLTDADHDGVSDADDACPHDPEDHDGYRDEDGCPDPDNDGDGIPDVRDRCPNRAEDPDGFQDQDGCPNPDNDGDGIPDIDDKCPNRPEDHDGFQDQDGCPDPDNDGDGIPDIKDQCPNQPETDNGFQDADGCRDTIPAISEWRGSVVPHAYPREVGVQIGGDGKHTPPVALVHGIRVQWVYGLEVIGEVATNWSPWWQVSPAVWIGAAPYARGVWLGRYGDLGLVYLQPTVHVGLRGVAGLKPVVAVGNRLELRIHGDTLRFDLSVPLYGWDGGGPSVALEANLPSALPTKQLGGFALFSAVEVSGIGNAGTPVLGTEVLADYQGFEGGLEVAFSDATGFGVVAGVQPVRWGPTRSVTLLAPFLDVRAIVGQGFGAVVGNRSAFAVGPGMDLGIELTYVVGPRYQTTGPRVGLFLGYGYGGEP